MLEGLFKLQEKIIGRRLWPVVKPEEKVYVITPKPPEKKAPPKKAVAKKEAKGAKTSTEG